MPVLPFLAALVFASPRLGAAHVDAPVKLDGRLDEPVWQKAPASDAFTQKQPASGSPPSERTAVRVLYDAEALYVGVECEQTRAEIIARLTRRDRSIEADSVTVAIDSRGDGKSAFDFTVNAASVLADAIRYNDTDYSQQWDENWEAQAARTPKGWSAEFRIPLRILRFRSLPVQSFGLQVRRYVSMRQEVDEWAYIPRDEGGEVSRYGRLDNLVGLRSSSSIELRPFITGVLRHHDPESSALARGFEPTLSAGLDAKWHISENLTLDATFLPDFGQVDADQVVLNLSNFEQYYPERRPFFLEGVDTFTTPFQLLYTRRIGRAPAEPSLIGAEKLVHPPVPSTIYGAAKIVGEIGEHLSVGELFAVTAAQNVEIQSPHGTRFHRLASPLSTYKVLRLKQDIGKNAHIGFIGTAVNRVEPTGSYPVAPGARGRRVCPDGGEIPAGERCFHDSYVLGLDGRWRSPSGEYAVSGQAIGSLIHKGPLRDLADGTRIGSGDAGLGAQARVAKEGGKNWIWFLQYEGLSRKVDYNDLGYMQRQNQHSGIGEIEYRDLEPGKHTLENHVGLNLRERDNLDGQNQFRGVALWSFTRFKSFWGLFSELHFWPARFDDREMGDGAAIERAGLFGAEVYFASDTRKRLFAESWTQLHLIENGVSAQGEGKVVIRALPQWDMELAPTWIYTTGEPRFIGAQGGSYVFGRQRAQSFGVTLRSTYTFTPRLTLQAYAQLFLEAQRYSQFTAAPARGAGSAVRLSDMRPFGAPLETDPDYEGGAFNANLVLRWEYRLGSTLYVVYTHAQSNSLVPRLGDGAGFDFRHIRPRLGEDALLVKMSYWWG